MPDPLVLAVDGGNTKTLALAATLDGVVRGSGRAGNGDIYAVGEEEAIAAIASAARAALADAGATGADVVGAILSLAGADWPEDFALHRTESARRIGLAAPPLVVNDAIGALRCGTADGVGAIVVCGTGGAVGARGADGAVFHLGFWPDGTGGAELGRGAQRAVERAALGLGPATALTAALCARLGIDDPAEAVHARTRRDRPRLPPADLAPLVLDAAAAGDAVALGLVDAQGAILGDYARLAAERVALPPGHPLVLAGGLLRHPSSCFVDALLARVPAARPVRARLEPVVGVLGWALERAGAALPADALRGVPGPDFFDSAR